MGILERLKRKTKKKKKVSEKKKRVAKKKPKPKAKEPKKKITSLAYKVLKSPHITEKSTELAKLGQYTFKVFDKANKPEIKKAIEELYGVDVLDVKVMNTPSKRKRLGGQEGRRPGFKKAIVKVKEGQKIDVFPH